MGAMFSQILPAQDADVLFLPPHHLIDHAGVALDDLHDLGGNILLHIIRHGDAVVAVLVHLHRRVHCLQQALFVDACEDEASLIQRFRALGAGADAHCWKWMPDAGNHKNLMLYQIHVL